MTAVSPATQRSNARTALIMAAVAAAMLGLAFASVPLYRLFCQVTGFAGTPQRALTAPGAAAGEVAVRFDANVRPGLPWKFQPVQTRVVVAPGAKTQVSYTAENLSDQPVKGHAVFNVSPDRTGKYFNKIACFCFTEQTLQPGQKVDMPVVFFLDPAVATDPDTKDISEITLSYTFYPVETGANGG